MEFTVVCAGGTLEFRSGCDPLALFDASGSSDMLEVQQKDPFVEELAYFTECVQQAKQPDLCPPADSGRAVKVAEILMESRERRGEEISCRF
jgi:hypothetical protein